jgi:hypothetical protein
LIRSLSGQPLREGDDLLIKMNRGQLRKEYGGYMVDRAEPLAPTIKQFI